MITYIKLLLASYGAERDTVGLVYAEAVEAISEAAAEMGLCGLGLCFI